MAADDDHAENESGDGNPQSSGHEGLSSLLGSEDLLDARRPRRPQAVADEVFAAAGPDRDPVGTFPQSVASGGPTPEGVLLWTRLAPGRFEPGQPLGVEVTRGDDETFDDPVFRGAVVETDALAAHDHTVSVDLDGVLAPDTEYRYRFTYRGTRSRVGTCRTLPAPDASPDSVRLAVLTCQNYANGYFPALSHVAAADVDFVVHVGDFIYESVDGHYRGLGSPALPDRDLSLPSGNGRAHGLADYRYLHRTYRADRHLQRLQESHTLIPAWDDHEIANDVYWDPDQDAPRADHPLDGDPEAMRRLVADALHAWWEYTPARVEYDPDGAGLQDRLRLWRDLQFGDLVDVLFTDERLFRHPPRDGLPTPGRVGPETEPPDRSMLGPAQRQWLLDTTRDCDATWTVWCDEVLTMALALGAGRFRLYPVQGGWDGYTRERRHLMERLASMDVENFVTLTGDAHCYIAGYQRTRYPDRWARLRGRTPGERVGVEFMTPPVTSVTVGEALRLTGRLQSVTAPLLRWLLTAMNPHFEFFDSHHTGYSTVEFTPEDCTYVAYGVDKTTDARDADREVVCAFRVPAGEVALTDVTGEYRGE